MSPDKSIKSHYSFRKTNLILGAILITGLIIRVLLIFTVEEPIDRDAKEYYSIASNIIDGNGFSIDGITPTSRRSPGYPFFLYLVIFIFGNHPNIIYLFQALLNIVTILLVLLSLNYIKIRNTTLIAVASLLTLSTSFIFTNVLYPEILTMFFIALILYISVNHNLLCKHPFIKCSIIGLLIGILIHMRPTFLYFPIFFLIVVCSIYLIKKTDKLPYYLTISITALVVVLPWTIRNKVVFNKWIPLVSAGGKELLQSNIEIDRRTVWYSVTDIVKYEKQRREGLNILGEMISDYHSKQDGQPQSNLNNYLSREARQNILRHPYRYLLLSVNRFLILWFSPPIGSTTLKSISVVIFWIVLAFKYVLTLISVFGIFCLCKKEWNTLDTILLLLLYLTLLHTFTLSIQRYFLPLIPLSYFSLGWILEYKLIPLSVIGKRIIFK